MKELKIPMIKVNQWESCVNDILKQAKRDKLISKIPDNQYQFGGRFDDIYYSNVFFDKNSNKILIGDTNSYSSDKKEIRHSFQLLFLSEDPISVDNLKEIFDYKILSSYKNQNFEITFDSIYNDDSKTKKGFKGYQKTVPFYSVIFTMAVKIIDNEQVTLEQIRKTDAYKKFIEETGFKEITGKRQEVNGTLMFALNKEYVCVAGEIKNQKDFISDNSPYFHQGFAIFRKGYVRKVPTYSINFSDQSQVMSKFDSTNLQGFETCLNELREYICGKWCKMQEKKGILIFLTPELRYANRGKISATGLGLI